MLVDNVIITVRAGNGGNGAVSFRRNEGNPRGGPDGGNGGKGGDVYLEGVNDLTALRKFRFKKEYSAENGISGKKKNLFGRNAKDLYLKVPLGTLITTTEDEVIGEITNEGEKILIVKGGAGGRGNNEFKSATNQAPRYAEKGEKGEEKIIHLELRLIADVGFVGLPNAGKSTLLSLLTNATPRIGNYPFTTLEPNLGMMDKIVLADIPGLIEGASSGKGLGIKFLKHIEKTKLLVHCIDITEKDVLHAYNLVRNEFSLYKKEILKKTEIIVLTKSDLVNEEELEKKRKKLRALDKKIIIVSVYAQESIRSLQEAIKFYFNYP